MFRTHIDTRHVRHIYDTCTGYIGDIGGTEPDLVCRKLIELTGLIAFDKGGQVSVELSVVSGRPIFRHSINFAGSKLLCSRVLLRAYSLRLIAVFVFAFCFNLAAFSPVFACGL